MLAQPDANAGSYSLERGKPRDSQKIADLMTKLSKGKYNMSREDVLEAFGEKAFLLLKMGDELVGMAGWQVENLVVRTLDLYLDTKATADKALPLLLDEVERLGYVERHPDPSDGRAKIVKFTKKGLKLMQHGTEIGDDIQERYAELIGNKKMQRLRDLLEELHFKIRHPD